MTVVFKVSTIKGIFFKYLFETLKGYIKELNLVFTPEGIKVTKKDQSKLWITYIFLDRENFESYYTNGKYVVGISVLEFHKFIKSIGVKDRITLSIEEDPQCLTMILENSSQGQTKRYDLPLLDLSEPIMSKMTIECHHKVSIPSKTFKDIIKEMSELNSESIQIISYDRKLVFTNDGDAKKTTRYEVTLQEKMERGLELEDSGDSGDSGDSVEEIVPIDENTKCITYNESNNDIIKGQYSIHYLKFFIKAMSMSPYMTIYMKNDNPLILEWNVGDLGVFRTILMESKELIGSTSSSIV